MKSWITFAVIGFGILVGCANKSKPHDSVAISPSQSEQESAPRQLPKSAEQERGEKEAAEAPPQEPTPKVAPKLAQQTPTRAPVIPKKPSWPNWMGPNHDGVSLEKGWSSDWPPAGLPLGLPIVRTSVDHGTALDIAWQGKADTTSMVNAILLATAAASGKRP